MSLFAWSTIVLGALVLGYLWLDAGGADWILRNIASFVRHAIRKMPDDETAECWAGRFRRAVEDGLADRAARRGKRP